MALNQGLLAALRPNTVRDYQAEDAKTALAQQLGAAELQQAALQTQNAQEEMQNKRRAMAVSMLGGIANEPDPAKQAALYATLKPMAERYDTTLKLPDEYDPSLTRALMYGQLDPKQQLAALTKETGPIKLGPGDVLFDPTTQQPIFTAPNRQSDTPVAVFDPATGQTKFVPKGTVIGSGYQPSSSAPNETEKVAAGYADRMTRQDQRLRDLEAAGANSADTWQNVKEGVPFVGNYLVSDQFQTLRQAQDDWIRAKLRKESGAVIGADEMEKERKTYFPMPGDAPAVILQKEQARQVATDAMIQNAGNAYRKQPGSRPLVTTQEQYDALPSGAVYTEDDGQVYVKP